MAFSSKNFIVPSKSELCPAWTSRLYASRKFTDLTIMCHGRIFPVHRAVVCMQSKPLAVMADGRFTEAVDKVIDLPENDPTIIGKMIFFLYHGSYSEPDIRREHSGGYEPMSDGDVLMFAVKMYTTADQYDIQPLKHYAAQRYAKLLITEWNSPSFVEGLKLMYETTPESDRGLKTPAMSVARLHATELCARDDFGRLCKEDGEIAFDVLSAAIKWTNTNVTCSK